MRARACYEESLALYQELGDRRGIAGGVANLAHIAAVEGHHERANDLYVQCLRLHRDLTDPRGLAGCLEGLAELMTAEKRPERAARLFGAAAQLRAHSGAVVPIPERQRYDRVIATLYGQIDRDSVDAAWAAGAAMTFEALLAEVGWQAKGELSSR